MLGFRICVRLVGRGYRVAVGSRSAPPRGVLSMQVADNVALITGGASGLGEATARHLHAAGARVLIFDRDEGRAKDIVADLGDGADMVVGDAASEADGQAAVEAALTLGPLRMLVACAGGG